ncbi:hypothetical protein [Rothia sp. ZJ932]|uniref:hypothetical protein n=1 Tax=Rothia sp. ZJ932 TaxID=2810516 RepID=UPI001967585C|nr:hypothetical protein [Rothia sp. ZJ932]QRZ61765.1 hypothetical protein JR346_01075 [Rothia sp. ZJ932]
MAYVDLKGQPQKRARLVTITLAVMCLVIVIPMVLVSVLTMSIITPPTFEMRQGAVETTARGKSEDQQCWMVADHLKKDNIFGAEVLSVRYETSWCAENDEITNISANYIIERRFGKWAIEAPEVKVLEKTDRSALVQLTAPLSFNSAIYSMGGDIGRSYELHSDGTAEYK